MRHGRRDRRLFATTRCDKCCFHHSRRSSRISRIDKLSLGRPVACTNSQLAGLGFGALNGEPAWSKRDSMTHSGRPIRRLQRSRQIASALSLSPFFTSITVQRGPFSTPKHRSHRFKPMAIFAGREGDRNLLLLRP
jgi:hypothetical protein